MIGAGGPGVSPPELIVPQDWEIKGLIETISSVS